MQYTTSRGPRCYESHPALPIGEFEVYGGNCGNPVVKNATVYVGLDEVSMYQHRQRFPWVKGHAFAFDIPNMKAPRDPAEFAKLVKWLDGALRAGRKIHVGCIGGHGRTGLVLAALVTFHTGEEDSIAYVREHYCKKAVETREQVEFLAEHYGIKPRKGSYEGKRGTVTGRTTSKSKPAGSGHWHCDQWVPDRSDDADERWAGFSDLPFGD